MVTTTGMAMLVYIIAQFPPPHHNDFPTNNLQKVVSSEKRDTIKPQTVSEKPVVLNNDINDIGKKLYTSLGCGGCHGVTGQSTIPSFPSLAGKDASYLVKQLLDFQSGARPSPMMANNAKKTQGNEQSIADYLASQ